VSVGEIAGIVRGLPVPTGSATVIIAVEVAGALIATLSLDLPFTRAAVCNPQSILRYAPRAILYAGVVHANRVCVLEGAAALAVNGSRFRT
jgi:hypothetical protein